MVDININNMFKISNLPFTTSVKIKLKLTNGIIDNKALLETFIKNAIIPGKKEMKVIGVRALWASLNDFDILAIAIHKPLTNKP